MLGRGLSPWGTSVTPSGVAIDIYYSAQLFLGGVLPILALHARQEVELTAPAM